MKPVLFVMTLLLTGLAMADDWPDVPVPDGVKREWVADSMVFNGVAMRIFTFNYPRDVEQLKRFYAKAWDEQGRDHKEARQGKWWVLSSLRGDYYTTVQITDLAGTTYAQVGVSRIADLRTSARASSACNAAWWRPFRAATGAPALTVCPSRRTDLAPACLARLRCRCDMWRTWP